MKQTVLITLSEHRLLGNIILPYLVDRREEQQFYSVIDRLNSADFKLYNDDEFSDSLKEIVSLTEEYEENHIVKFFSKKKQNSHDFFSKLDKEFIQDKIRPYIEERLVKIIDLILENDFPFFYKDSIQNIHDEDQIELVRSQVETLFNFEKGEEQSKYFLTVKHENHELSLTDQQINVITNTPSRLIRNGQLLSFKKIDSKKLKPFFTKPFVLIPKNSEEKYFQSFVKTAIKNYAVKAKGFEINEVKTDPVPIIYIEKDLKDTPVLRLIFDYHDDVVFRQGDPMEPMVFFNNDDGHYSYMKISRDDQKETDLINLLLSLDLVNADPSNFVVNKEEASLHSLIHWLSEHENILKENGFRIEQLFFDAKYSLRKAHLNVVVNSGDQDWFDINATVKVGDFEIPFSSFRNHIISGNREYTLPNGKVFVLPKEWLSDYHDLFLFGESKGGNILLKNHHYTLLDKKINLPKSKYFDKLKKLHSKAYKRKIELPKNLKAEMRPYQKEGFSWMTVTNDCDLGACLADDMGLGKTLQTLAVLQHEINENRPAFTNEVDEKVIQKLPKNHQDRIPFEKKRQASLIIMPASLVHNWYNEIKKFTPDLTVHIHTGTNRSKNISHFSEYDVVLTTYGTMRVDYAILNDYHFFYLVLDESQVIKNFHSKTYQSVNALQADKKLVLTGTPIENSLNDLWAQMNFLNDGVLGSYAFFKDEFINPIEKTNDVQKREKLKRLIQPFILRRTKKEVAKDLPQLTEQIIYCELTDEQDSFYEQEKSKIRNNILETIESDGLEKSTFLVLQGLTKLRQLANHPRLVEGAYAHQSGKFIDVTRNIDKLSKENHKTLIFSSFVKHLEVYETYLKEHNIPHVILTGESKHREKIVEDFQKNNDIKFFLISVKAGGVGLNLTAADYVFLLDPWWNPAVESQAINRAHRIGQEQNVFVYRFISKGTIEEKILRLQAKKSKLADDFINSNNPFKNMSVDSVMELFQ